MNRTALILYILMCLTLSSPFSRAQGRVSSLKDTAESLLVDAVQDYDSGNTEAALALLSVITEAFPDNDAAHYYTALCRIRQNDAEGAVKELMEASRLDPDNYWYKDHLATLYAMTGQDDAAVEVYESLLKDHPRKTELY